MPLVLTSRLRAASGFDSSATDKGMDGLLTAVCIHHCTVRLALLPAPPMLPTVFLLLVSPVIARLVNITVDDKYGDPLTGVKPIYKPDDFSWKARTAGDGCSTCGAQPDGKLAHNGTWHDNLVSSDSPSSFFMTFNGTQIYIYCILLNNIGFGNLGTSLSFSLDGASVGDLAYSPDMAIDGYLYDQLVFQSDVLPAGEHTITVVNSLFPDGDKSVVLFDYAIYTTELDDSASSSTTVSVSSTSLRSQAPSATTQSSSGHVNLGAIVGGAVGGAAVVFSLFGVLLALVIARRRQRQSVPSGVETSARDPYEREGFIDHYMSYRPHEDGSPYSAAFSSPQASPGPTEGFNSNRYSTQKPGLTVMHAGTDISQTPVHEGDLRGEVGKMRTELEMLKTAFVPPQYTE